MEALITIACIAVPLALCGAALLFLLYGFGELRLMVRQWIDRK